MWGDRLNTLHCLQRESFLWLTVQLISTSTHRCICTSPCTKKYVDLRLQALISQSTLPFNFCSAITFLSSLWKCYGRFCSVIDQVRHWLLHLHTASLHEPVSNAKHSAHAFNCMLCNVHKRWPLLHEHNAWLSIYPNTVLWLFAILKCCETAAETVLLRWCSCYGLHWAVYSLCCSSCSDGS